MHFDYVTISIFITRVVECIVGFIGIKKMTHLILPLQILAWYFIISIIIDIIVDILVYYKIPTYLESQSLTVIELLLFSSIFYLWRTSKRNGYLVWIGCAVYLLIWIIGKFTFEPITGWDNYTEPIDQLFQIGFGGWLLLGILKETDIALKEDPRFWILSGIVLHAVATFFFFGLFTPMLISNRKLLRAIWPLNDAVLIMQYFFFLRAFLCKPVNAGITNTSQILT